MSEAFQIETTAANAKAFGWERVYDAEETDRRLWQKV